MMKATVVCARFAIPLVWVSILAAGQPKHASPAPVPAQILTAKKVFVANAGADAGAYPFAAFSGKPERTYDNFYAAMKTWGHYQLVSASSDADLLLEIRFTVRPGPVQRGDTTSLDAQFRLVIRDPKTHAMLWAMTEQVENAMLQANRDKNFDQALARIVADIERLTAPSTFGDSNRQ